MGDHCTNCGGSEAEPYDLPLRNDEPTETYLCDSCHAAIVEAVAAE